MVFFERLPNSITGILLQTSFLKQPTKNKATAIRAVVAMKALTVRVLFFVSGGIIGMWFFSEVLLYEKVRVLGKDFID